MKTKITILFTSILISTSALSNNVVQKLFGINGSKLDNNASGAFIETEIENPLSEFTLLGQSIASDDMINDIPGRIVAVCQKGTDTYLIQYGNIVLKDNVTPPKINNTKMTFESLLIDTKSAANIGFVVAEAGTATNYRVEYNLFKGPTASVRSNDIDNKKFTTFFQVLKKNFQHSHECKLKDVHYIETATLIYQTFKVLKKNEGNTKVTGPGWNIDGNFYNTNQKEQNKTLIAVKTIPLVVNDLLLLPEPELMNKNSNSIQGIRSINVDKNSLGNLGKESKNIFEIQ